MENNIPETYEDCHGKKYLQQQSSHKLTNMNKSSFYSQKFKVNFKF